MQVHIIVTLPTEGPETEAAGAWFGSFQSWLDIAPQKVAVEIYNGQTLTYTHPFVNVGELKEFFAERLPRSRVHYNARMVFYWLITNLHRDLEVRCAACLQRYLKCQCEASGYRRLGPGPDEWCYGDLTPDSDKNENVWLIGRRSLVKLPMSVLEGISDRSSTRRERVIQFLHFLQDNSGA